MNIFLIIYLVISLLAFLLSIWGNHKDVEDFLYGILFGIIWPIGLLIMVYLIIMVVYKEDLL